MTDEDLPQTRRLSEAIFWRIQLEEHGREVLAGWQAWIAESADNHATWLRVQRIWSCFGKSSLEPEIMKLRQGSLDRLQRMPSLEIQSPFEDS
jgi:ferric-dicitrate binding protein FerR (iron transport regulator)